uniref:Putative secreted protein n=1 Tax=Ixodes ricinus TaxID=34613 RepID=A0A6B0U8J9_IXORI
MSVIRLIPAFSSCLIWFALCDTVSHVWKEGVAAFVAVANYVFFTFLLSLVEVVTGECPVSFAWWKSFLWDTFATFILLPSNCCF